jgi:hypothetical protein
MWRDCSIQFLPPSPISGQEVGTRAVTWTAETKDGIPGSQRHSRATPLTHTQPTLSRPYGRARQGRHSKQPTRTTLLTHTQPTGILSYASDVAVGAVLQQRISGQLHPNHIFLSQQILTRNCWPVFSTFNTWWRVANSQTLLTTSN